MVGAAWAAGAAPTGARPLLDLLGREDDAARLRDRCHAARLVTLLGPGGVGKTSLAAATAPDVAADHDAVPHWVDLRPLRDEAAVPAAVAEAVGADARADRDTAARELVAALDDRSVLLVLDNCEHVVGAVAELVDVLVRACPAVRVLTTSRELLGVPGEDVVRLGPLPVPPVSPAPDAAALAEHAGTALLLARAGLDARDLDTRTRAAAASVSRTLDGLPLAIELAAARHPVLSLPQLDEALAHRFRVLSTRARTIEDRQRTLETSIAWSYDLLGADEQRMLRSLAVFPGGFDLVGAAVVGAGGDQLDALDALDALVAKSMVVVQERESSRRYRLLESIRAFCRARLEEADELAAANDHHLAATIDRLRRLGADETTEGLLLRLDAWLVDELDDVLAASEHATSSGRHGDAVELWWALHPWSVAYGLRSSAWRAITAIDEPEDELARVRLLTLRGAGPAPGGPSGNGEAARAAVDAAADLGPADTLTAVLARLWSLVHDAWRFGGDVADEARAVWTASQDRLEDWGPVPGIVVGMIAAKAFETGGRPDLAYESSLWAAEQADRHASDVVHANALFRAASAAGRLGVPEAPELIRRALDATPTARVSLAAWIVASSGFVVALATGDFATYAAGVKRYGRLDVGGDFLVGMMRYHGVVVALEEGDPATARRLQRDLDGSLANSIPYLTPGKHALDIRIALELGDLDEARRLASFTTDELGSVEAFPAVLLEAARIVVHAVDGRPAAALAIARRAAELCVATLNRGMLPTVAAATAEALVAAGRPQDASRTLGTLWGELETREAVGLWPWWQRRVDEVERAGRAAIGDRAWGEAVAHGRTTSWDEWAAWLTRGAGARGPERPTTGWAALTDAEAAVAAKVAEGLSNAQVAETLFVSVNTVKTHLKHVYSKLEVSNRVELAAVVPDAD